MKRAREIVRTVFPHKHVDSIHRFRKGIINKTYELKTSIGSYVLRIYPKDHWKIEKEKYIYGLIGGKTDVPVPKVYTSGKDYIVLTRIEGKELDIKDNKAVKQAGEYLAKIHRIKFPYFGWIVGKEIKPKFKDWEKFVGYENKEKLKRIPNEMKKDFNRIFKQNKDLLKIKSKPCLLHKDYHKSHILVEKHNISGIIDVEWAIAGHNELDIAKSCLWMFDGKPEKEKIFLQGYKKFGKISKDYPKRKILYKIMILMSALSLAKECCSDKWTRINMKKLKGAFDEYHKNH
jgi:fructosamine-3-kinase